MAVAEVRSRPSFSSPATISSSNRSWETPPSFTSWCVRAARSSSQFTTAHFSVTTAARRSASRLRRDELVAHWAQDLGRVIDYLEQRPDIDATKVAFAGLSLGAGLTPNLLAYEPRVKASILWSGGFFVIEDQRSIDNRIGLARRMTVPILMLGGSRDSAIPVDPNQRALFRFFGTPEQDKRMQVYEGAGHWPLPMNDVIRESVDFLDRYLGPVTSGP